MKTNKIVFWVATGLFSLMMLAGAFNYFFSHEAVVEAFDKLGFPAWMVYPLATAKLLGVIAILTRRSKLLQEWAYAGFFFNTAMATGAHLAVGDGDFGGPMMAMVLLLVSRFFVDRAFPAEAG